LSHLVLNPTCCIDDLPSRRSAKEFEVYKGPADVGLLHSIDVSFVATDGHPVEGWLIAPVPDEEDGQDKLVVLVHDTGADKRQLLELGVAIHEHTGWGLLFIDHREGTKTAFGTDASLDVLAALQFIHTGGHEALARIKKVAIMGTGIGGAAATFAMIKDTSVDSLVIIDTPSSAYSWSQAHLKEVLLELRDSVNARLASNSAVSWQARLTSFIVENVYKYEETTASEEMSEASNFMAQMSTSSAGLFLDMAAHLTIVYGAGYKTWLQGLADSQKVVHRVQPRGFMMVHGSMKEKAAHLEQRHSIEFATQLYNRAGMCTPKMHHMYMYTQPSHGSHADLASSKNLMKKLSGMLPQLV